MPDPHVGPPSECSWWPTLNKYEDSGLNLGVWTPRCEEWFQRRRALLLTEIGLPHTASKWRTLLRGEAETKRLLKGSRQLAGQFIKLHFCLHKSDAYSGADGASLDGES